jgi:hypothetical protein
VLRIWIRDRVLFNPWIRNRFFRIPDPKTIFLRAFWHNFFGKKFYNSLKIGPNFFFQHFKAKIITILWNLWLHKKVWQLIFFHLSLLLLFLDPGFEIRDPGWVKIRIRDKHPGSATLCSMIWKYLCYWRLLLFSQEVFVLVPTVGVSSDSRGVCGPLSDPGSCPGEGHPADGT